MRELSDADYETIQAFIDEARDKGTHYAGMSYEDGLAAVLDVLDENQSAKEVCE